MDTSADAGFAPPEQRLASLLERRVDEITREWHAQIDARVRLRPGNVFPGEALLDGMPRLVHWITRSLREGAGPGKANEDSVRGVAEHWREAGISVEESLLHFRLLAALLFERLEELIARHEAGVDPVDAVRAAGRLCHAIDTAQVVLVATYRDAEEERITEFGTTLAHEVRDHIGAAVTAIQLMRALRDEADPDREPDREDELLKHAGNAAERANEVVGAVRALSRAGEVGRDGWGARPLRDLVEHIVADLRARSGSDVHLKVEDGIPDDAVPESPVSLILHNLLANAIKYSDPEKSEKWVRIHGRREDDGHIVVQVGDNGLGVSEAEQERIFQRFRRGSKARGDGFGLGLAIVQRAARSIGSRLMLESSPGHGSTFGFTIPVEVLEAPDDCAEA